jgi:hypothetical protein
MSHDLFQYQQKAQPLVDSQPTDTRHWQPTFPDRIPPRPGLPAALQYAAPPQGETPVVVPDRSWAPGYPDRVPSAASVVWQLPFVTTLVDSQPTDTRAWRPIHPDRIDRLVVRAADQLAFATGMFAPVFPVADFAWRSIAPDLLWQLRLPVAAVPTFALDPLPRPDVQTIETFVEFPAWIARATFTTADQQSTTLDPFPRPPAPRLFAFGHFPDQIARQTIAAALQSTLGSMNLVPIPNPPNIGGVEDPIRLGLENSLAARSHPALGGWEPFGG